MSDYNTPMMRQHAEIKEKYPDAFLFFRCGDFYELFGKDAEEAVKILNIALTKRQNTIPMCGVPYHAVDTYINRLVKAGKKVAICDQIEDPKTAKGIVKRAVTQVVTPGTVIEEKHLEVEHNNFLVAIAVRGLWLELGAIDISTGDFELREFELTHGLEGLKAVFCVLNPHEVIIAEDVYDEVRGIKELFAERDALLVNRFPSWYFDENESKAKLFAHYKVSSLKEMGIVLRGSAGVTPGVLLKYVESTFGTVLEHLRLLRLRSLQENMELDEATIKNLELLNNTHDGSSVNTLLEVIDYTKTSVGSRLLKRWIMSPLVIKEKIEERHNIVELLYKNYQFLDSLRGYLGGVSDIERLTGRLVTNKGGPKDLIALRDSIIQCNEIKMHIAGYEVLRSIEEAFHIPHELLAKISDAILDEPSTFIEDGNVIRDGYNEELDELRSLAQEGREYIAAMEARMREKYATPSLKIRYNKIIGYYFEVSKLQSQSLDDSFLLRQSLVNGNRYTNQELSEYESKVMNAKEGILVLEKNLYEEVREMVSRFVSTLHGAAQAVSELDVLASYAKAALEMNYVRPEICDGFELEIVEGRHPVVERRIDYHAFIPNDVKLTKDEFVYVITGPNMAGKSTYLRQNALIVLLAQIGAFVPASRASIGIVDRIFTRIGSSDNLSRGESTFFVEMSETAFILRHATGRSLIIMDEIGRGTSTKDGLAIATAIVSYIKDKRLVGAKTLFATHYHELTALGAKPPCKNVSVSVIEKDGDFVFLHKIVPEPAKKSYGVYVAQLAGLPEEVTSYASSLLEEDEGESSSSQEVEFVEVDLFGVVEKKKNAAHTNEMLDVIRYLNLDRLTPLQALQMLHDIQKKL